MSVKATVSIDPECGEAGQLGTWSLRVEVASGVLEVGDVVFFIPQQKAAKVWGVSQFTDPWEVNYTAVETDAAAALVIVPADSGILRGAQKYSIGAKLVSGSIAAGESLRFVFGDTSAGSPGMRMLTTAHRFVLQVAIAAGEGSEPSYLPNCPSFTVTPARPAAVKAIAPSVVVPETSQTLRISVVDAFGNPCNATQDIQIAELGGVEIEDAGGRDSTFRKRFSAAGVLPSNRITFHARYGELEGRSNPIRISTDSDDCNIYWGDIHAHSDLAQGLESPEFVYNWAREVEGLDFLAHVEHDAAGDIDIWVGEEFRNYQPGMSDIREYIAQTWELRKELVRKHYESGTFVPFLGYEWASNVYGHMNVIYRDVDAPIFYPDGFWNRDFDPAKLWNLLEDHDAITIPHHSSTVCNWAYASGTNWDYFDNRFARLVEIYSKWGSSEYFGCPRAPIHQTPGTTVIEGLKRGYRFGFVGGSDSHTSRPGSDFVECGWDGVHRQSGLTAVYAKELTRDAIYEALRSRRCYATTAARMLIDFKVNGRPMGSEITVDFPEQTKEIYFEVVGTADVERVEIVKNGLVMYRYLGIARESESLDPRFTIPDHQPTSASGDFYYLRVVQKDGCMGWASPIWVSPEQ